MAAFEAAFQLELRPLESSDAIRLARFYHRLSPLSLYRRFLTPMPEPRQADLEKLLNLDHRDREAIGALIDGEIVGVARYARLLSPDTAELAVVVADGWQRRGFARLLLATLASRAKENGVKAFVATMLGDNRPALTLARRLAPGAEFHWVEGAFEARIPLQPGI